MRVLIIGGGSAGIAAARHVLAAGFECEVLEASSHLGGMWGLFTDYEKYRPEDQKFNLMYEGLRANLPKEVMFFPDFNAPKEFNSFPTQAEVGEYLNLYAEYYNIKPHVKLNRKVINIKRIFDKKWEVISLDSIKNEEFKDEYDSVMICSGIYHTPSLPIFPGQENFRGKQLHSICFKRAKHFKDHRILVVGAGTSAADIVCQLSSHAKYVALSHHCTEFNLKIDISNVEEKPDIQYIREDEIEFVDGSRTQFDTIIYCTGYKKYLYPFLDSSCGVTAEGSHVYPLYKHMLNIEDPTMCFIGVPYFVCAFRLYYQQARAYVKILQGSVKLPSKADMKEEADRFIEGLLAQGQTKKKIHEMKFTLDEYFKEIAEWAGIKNVPPVVLKILDDVVLGIYGNIQNYRKYNYEIIDENKFIKTCVVA